MQDDFDDHGAGPHDDELTGAADLGDLEPGGELEPDLNAMMAQTGRAGGAARARTGTVARPAPAPRKAAAKPSAKKAVAKKAVAKKAGARKAAAKKGGARKAAGRKSSAKKAIPKRGRKAPRRSKAKSRKKR